MSNVLLMTDSYKVSHFKQYPDGTEHVYSYIEPRKGSYPIVVLGISDFVDYISVELNERMVNELQETSEAHGVPFNHEGWSRLLDKYAGLGFPVKVYGVPEGSVVDPGTPVASIVNTDPEFPWLTSFFETLFLRCVWYPSTVASRSRYVKSRIKEFMLKTGADMSTLEFKLHDFGARGATCGQAAAIGGAAHLTQFLGTDTMESLVYVREKYGVPMAGFSIPATEHSTVTSWGREHEEDMYREFIKRNGGEGRLFACVSDSYNIWEALKLWKKLEPELLAAGGTLVIRPDSGDPVLTPVKVVQDLLELFGGTPNEKGFLVLPSHIRVIQGDGVDESSIVRIMQRLYDAGISIDNIAFGMGGGLLQKLDRDTLGWAMKCSAAKVNGVWRDVYKDPVAGGKTSKRGLVFVNGVVDYDSPAAKVFLRDGHMSYNSYWTTYYNNGTVAPRDSWESIRERSKL